jgi:hypothetical protein
MRLHDNGKNKNLIEAAYPTGAVYSMDRLPPGVPPVEEPPNEPKKPPVKEPVDPHAPPPFSGNTADGGPGGCAF